MKTLRAFFVLLLCTWTCLAERVVFAGFDLSATAWRGGNPYDAAWWQLLGTVEGGDHIYAAVVNNRGMTNGAPVIAFTIRPYSFFTDNRKEYETAVRAKLEKQREALSAIIRHATPSKKTEIIGFLQEAAHVLGAYSSKTTKIIVIWTDGLQEGDEVDLTRGTLSDDEISKIIETEKGAGRLPKLNGVAIWFVTSPSVESAQFTTSKLLRLEAFWRKYVQACGGEVKAFSPVLVNFGGHMAMGSTPRTLRRSKSPPLNKGATMYIWRDKMSVLSLNGRNDLIRLVDLFTGTLITGSPGSGKTSTTAKYLHSGLLRMRAGGYAPCAKPTDFRDHMRLITAEGRAEDVIAMRPGKDCSETPTNAINVLDLEQKLFGHGRANVTNVVNLLMRIMALIERKSGQSATSGDATFWMKYAQKIIKAGLTVQSLNSNRFDLKQLLKFVNSLPNTPEQAEDLNLYAIGQLQEAASKAGPNPPFEFTQVFDFVTREWPSSPPNSRGSGALTVQVLLDVLLSHEVRTLLFEETTFDLEQVLNHGGILLLDMDVEHYPLTGPVVGMVLKDIISRACKARPELTQMEPELVQPVYLLVDEAPEFLVEADQAHARTARSSRLVQIFISQTTTSVRAVFQDKDKAGDLLDLAGNRWAHQNGSDETNEFMAKTIGKIIVNRRGGQEGTNMNFGSEFTHGQNHGQNYNEQVDWDCPPRIMSRLMRPSPENGLQSQAVYWSNGRKFEWNDRRWLPVAMRVHPSAHRRDEACVIAKARMKGGDSRVEKFASKLFDSAAEARWQRLRSFLR